MASSSLFSILFLFYELNRIIIHILIICIYILTSNILYSWLCPSSSLQRYSCMLPDVCGWKGGSPSGSLSGKIHGNPFVLCCIPPELPALSHISQLCCSMTVSCQIQIQNNFGFVLSSFIAQKKSRLTNLFFRKPASNLLFIIFLLYTRWSHRLPSQYNMGS